MLAVLLIPIALSGCSFGKTTLAKSKDQVWYYFDKSDKELEAILIVDGDKITDYHVNGDLSFKDIKGKDISGIKKVIKQYNAKHDGKYGSSIEPREYNVSYSVYTDQNDKVIEEGIKDKENNYVFAALTDAKSTITVDGTKLYGFKSVESADQSNTELGDNGYLVTDSDKVEFDSGKTDGVTQFSSSELNNLVDSEN